VGDGEAGILSLPLLASKERKAPINGVEAVGSAVLLGGGDMALLGRVGLVCGLGGGETDLRGHWQVWLFLLLKDVSLLEWGRNFCLASANKGRGRSVGRGVWRLLGWLL